jgi:hypothetical protein
MLNRREFLQIGLYTIPVNYLNKFDILINKKMSEIKKYTATLYYRHTLKALKDKPNKESYNGFSNVIKVKFESGGKIEVYVNPYEHYKAAIEASALLDLGELSETAGTISISYIGNSVWYAYSWAPYGIGNRKNALVPGRDYAQNYWQFGTRLNWGPPDILDGICRPIMYLADVFGGTQPSTRIDLFAGIEGIDFGKRTIEANITFPNDKISSYPVRGMQQCCNILGIKGRDNKPLTVDNIYGNNSKYAFKYWLGLYKHWFTYGLPKYQVPWDSEIYFLIRESAKQ